MSHPERQSHAAGLLRRAFLESRPGRVAVAWSLAGGVTAGGLLVAAVTFSGHLSSSLAASTCTILFVLGTAAGFVHGGILGYLGRRLDRPRYDAVVGLGVALLILVPTAPLAWLASLLVALSSTSIVGGDVGLRVGALGD